MTFAEPTKQEVLSDHLSARSAVVSRRDKRILIYGINYTPEPIGVGRYSGELGAYLTARGFEVDVVTAVPHYPGWQLRNEYKNAYLNEVILGARVTRCPIWLGKHVHGIWRLIAPLSFALSSAPVAFWRILCRRPTTVLCVEPTLFSAPVAMVAARLVGAKTVLHVQDLEVDAAFATGHLCGGGIYAKAASFFERTVLKAFDAVVTISGRMQERLRDKGIAQEKLAVIRNWVDLAKFETATTGANYRRELGISDQKFVVLYSGNLGVKQGLNVLLDAARALASEPALQFIIAGDGPEKSRLAAQYADLPNVRFIPLQPECRLSEFLCFPDVHVLPQERGAADLVLPSKLGGMLASQKSCIVMADPGTELHNFLGDCVTLISPGDAVKLAEAIRSSIARRENSSPTDRGSRLQLLDARYNLSAFEAVLSVRKGVNASHPVSVAEQNF